MAVNLLELEPAGFAQYCAEMGEKPFRARQLMRWIHKSGAENLDVMTDIPKALRERIKQTAEIAAPHGHDAFLLDNPQYHGVVGAWFGRIAREVAGTPSTMAAAT